MKTIGAWISLSMPGIGIIRSVRSSNWATLPASMLPCCPFQMTGIQVISSVGTSATRASAHPEAGHRLLFSFASAIRLRGSTTTKTSVPGRKTFVPNSRLNVEPRVPSDGSVGVDDGEVRVTTPFVPFGWRQWSSTSGRTVFERFADTKARARPPRRATGWMRWAAGAAVSSTGTA